MKYKITSFFTILFFVFVRLCHGDPFNDYHRVDFEFQGRSAIIVFPKVTNQERFWIWRARFWGHEPQVDLALLELGFHLVYVDVAGLFGNPDAVEIWSIFYDYLIEKYQLNSKAVLEGMSRGGLIVYNWASQNVDKVACIYADAPVCDIKSWPGGMGDKNRRSEEHWEKCLDAYDLTEETVIDFEGIPINNSIKIAQAGIPVLHVCGNRDKSVPLKENTRKLEKKFKEAGGNIQVIIKKGVGHHPHSLKNPELIVRFILDNTLNRKIAKRK